MKSKAAARQKKTPFKVDAYGAKIMDVGDTQPYWDIVSDAWARGAEEDLKTAGLMVNETGHIEFSLRLDPPSRMLMSDENLEARHYDLKTVLQVGIPEGERARLYIRISTIPYDRFQNLKQAGKNGKNPVAQFLVKKRLDRLDDKRRQGTIKEWSFYLTCTVKPSRPFSKDSPPDPEHLRKEVQRAQRRREELLNRVRNAGYRAEAMSAQEMFQEAWYYHNLDFLGGTPPQLLTESKARYEGAPTVQGAKDFLTLKRQILTTPTRTEDHAVVVNGSTLVYAVSLHELPRQTEFGVLNAVAERITTGNMLFCIEVAHRDHGMEMEALEGANSKLHSATTSTKYAPSASAQQRYGSIKETLALVYEEGDNFYDVGVSVLLFAQGRDQLNEMLSQASTAFALFRSPRPIMHGYQSKHLYRALAPFNGRRTEFSFKLVETNAVGFMPAIAPFQGAGGGTLLYRNRSNALTTFDPFAAGMGATHFMVIAPTRWGKTFLTQSMVLALIPEYDPVVTVIDRKNDFKDMIMSLGGVHVEFGGGGSATFNPMDLPAGEHAPDEGKMTFLLTLWRDFIPRNSDEERAGLEDTVLREAILMTYKAFYQEELPPRLRDVHGTLDTMTMYSDGDPMRASAVDVARSLAARMRPFLHDSNWGKVIDQYTNRDTNAKYMYYDLSKIPINAEQETKIAMRIVQDRVWQSARLIPGRKLCLVEEMGSTIRTKSDRDYMASWLRMGASFGLSVGGITQLAADLENMPELRDSFSWFFFGRLTNTDGLTKHLKMPATVAKAVTGLQKVDKDFTEWVLAFRPDEGDVNGEIIRVEESEHFFWLCSSQENHRRLREAAIKARHGDQLAAVEDLVAGRYPEIELAEEETEEELGSLPLHQLPVLETEAFV
ncbi:VirB4 family type IV secretion system protein [Deinococcus aquaedulcis]|uniref:VirB4 family type IV secretion system protein n=1 Tax=Deinococcus aquaedulcis TaxID=2840455 RepID=UPI001C82BF88|nr:hypothetical protein [Deinococcus aquaedulcis]